MSSRLSIHHVGARDGSRTFPIVPHFESDVVNVLYDADPDCLEQVRQLNADLASELHVLPHCIGASAGRASLHLNYDPYTSSMRSLNPDYANYYMINPGCDYLLRQTFETVRALELEVNCLDELLAQNPQVPPPDFLSLDTQGVEFEILTGARVTLKDVLGLVVEVELHPLYLGQKLFGDVCALLAEQGFHFVRFLELTEIRPHRAPQGLRGLGLQGCGDALFLRDYATLDGDWLRLRKLAFFSILWGQMEYALACLGVSSSSRPANAPAQNYLGFLDEFESAVSQMPKNFPPTFRDLHPTFESSQSRFAPRRRFRASVWLEKFAPGLLGWLRYGLRRAGGTRRQLKKLWQSAFRQDSPAEKVLRQHGLRMQARLLRDNQAT